MILRRGTHRCAVWFTTWDTIVDAREAESAALAVPRLTPNDSVERRGRAVMILRNAPLDVRREARTAFRTFASEYATPANAATN